MKTRRLAALGCLVTLAALEFLAPPVFPVLVSIILLLTLGISWMAWHELRMIAREMAEEDIDNELLKRDIQDAEATALAATAAGGVGLYAILRVLKVAPQAQDLILIGLSFALIMISAPAINWYIYWHGKRTEKK